MLANRQLRHIHDHIAGDSPLFAGRISEALVEKTIDLDELPRKGRRVPELNEDTLWESGRLYTYRILYQIKFDHLIEGSAEIHNQPHGESDEIPREKPMPRD